ncbi:MAG TPA: GDSL-type esterase/lipase family protein [Candidatus Saccharimonadales bacterium]|jgi:lysophospholipase L1-like esterase
MSHPKFSKSAAQKIAASFTVRAHGRRPSADSARLATFAVVFAAIGSILLFGAHAATGGKAIQLSPSAGQISGNASVVSDSSAIGGKAARFGTNMGSAPTSCGTATSGAAQPSGSSYGSNALQQWNCALANRASTPATWVLWGDSITEGQGSSTVAGRWANQTLTALRSKYAVSGVTGGFGYIPSFYYTYGPDSQWSTDPTLSGSTSQNTARDDGNDGGIYGNGAGLGLLTVTLKSGGSETFKATGTSIDILYNYGSGSFSYKVDSGAVTTVSASGGSGATGSTHVAFSAAGSHTVVISGVSGSVVLEGVMTYNGDEAKGIRQYVGAQSGTTSGDFAAQAANLAAITASVRADLVTIEIGGNDYNRSSGTPAQTTANIQAMVSDIRAAGAAVGHTPSIVIVNVYPIAGNNDAQGYPESAYASAIKAVTTADPSLGYLDFASLGATGNEPSPYLSSTDNLHPNNTGQTRLAGMVESYLEDE